MASKEKIPIEERFQMNVECLFDDLESLYEDKDRPQLLHYIKLMKGLVSSVNSQVLLNRFLFQIETEAEDGSTLKDAYLKGHYFSLIIKFIDSFPLGKDVLKDDDFDLLGDGEKEILIQYIHSFFKIAEKYKKEKNGARD